MNEKKTALEKILKDLEIKCDCNRQYQDVDILEMQTSLHSLTNEKFKDDEDYLMRYAENCSKEYVIIQFQTNYCGGFNFKISEVDLYPEYLENTECIVIPAIAMYNALID